jgi:hypothetical protein
MTTEFLVLANVWLFTRLVCLFRDEPSSGRAWRIKAGIELIALAVLYPVGRTWAGLALTLTSLNVLGFWLERRARRRDFVRLLIGLAGLAAFSIWLSPRLGPGFRPELATWSAQLGSWTSLAPMVNALSHHGLHLVLFGVLVSANESNLVIRAVFDWLDLKPRLKPGTGGAVEVDVGEFNRGRIIGVLERVLLFSFVLQSQYGAIGFILAAKAFTRFKALDDRPFAEYVLIGTLLSACLALATGGAVLWLLRH